MDRVTHARQKNDEVLERALERVFGDRKIAESLSTERALQCALYAALMEERSDRDAQRVLVEPTFAEFEPKGIYPGSPRPDLLVVRPPQGEGGRGIIDIGIEMKVKPWSHVEFEGDIEKLIAYKRARSVVLRYGIDLDEAGKKRERFDIVAKSTVWAFVAVGQSASEVAAPKAILRAYPMAEGIVASCLVARSKGEIDMSAKSHYWVHVVGDAEPPVRKSVR